MRLMVVAILALGALAGCGVGLEEGGLSSSDVASAAQALEELQPLGPLVETPANPRVSGGMDGGSAVGLPQDPIPLFQGQALPAPVPGSPFSPTLAPGVPLPPH